MSVFLIDYENVSSSGLDGLEHLTTDDAVFIFYSENADRLTFDAHRRLMASMARVHYFKAESGSKNALDFQLASYLGYLIHENRSAAYHIISKDAGFDSVIKFWVRQGVSIQRLSNLDVETSHLMQTELKQILTDLLDEQEVRCVLEMIQKYKTKQGLNNALMKQFDNKKTSEIYRVIKPYIANKKGQ